MVAELKYDVFDARDSLAAAVILGAVSAVLRGKERDGIPDIECILNYSMSAASLACSARITGVKP